MVTRRAMHKTCIEHQFSIYFFARLFTSKIYKFVEKMLSILLNVLTHDSCNTSLSDQNSVLNLVSGFSAAMVYKNTQQLPKKSFEICILF